jgi:hypothetical protein
LLRSVDIEKFYSCVVCSSAVFVARAAGVIRAPLSMAVHAEVHRKAGFMYPLFPGGQIFVARRAGIICVASM